MAGIRTRDQSEFNFSMHVGKIDLGQCYRFKTLPMATPHDTLRERAIRRRRASERELERKRERPIKIRRK